MNRRALRQSPPLAPEPGYQKAGSVRLITSIPVDLSAQQVAICRYLCSLDDWFTPCPPGQDYGGSPVTTGLVVEAIGRRKDKAAYASVSRALKRLEDRGLVEVATPGCRLRGGVWTAFIYRLTDTGRTVDWIDEK